MRYLFCLTMMFFLMSRLMEVPAVSASVPNIPAGDYRGYLANDDVQENGRVLIGGECTLSVDSEYKNYVYIQFVNRAGLHVSSWLKMDPPRAYDPIGSVYRYTYGGTGERAWAAVSLDARGTVVSAYFRQMGDYFCMLAKW